MEKIFLVKISANSHYLIQISRILQNQQAQIQIYISQYIK